MVTVPIGAIDLVYVETGHVKAAGNRFLKRVAATEGDRACSGNGQITINGLPVATVAQVDSAGVALPHWSGCKMHNDGEVFLRDDDTLSFDGCYWGVTSITDIEGAWRRFP